MPRIPSAAASLVAVAAALGLLPAAAHAAAPQLSVAAGNGIFGTPVAGPALSSPLDGQPGTIITSPGGAIAFNDYERFNRVDAAGEMTVFGNGNPGTVAAGPVGSQPIGYGYGYGGAADGTIYYPSYENSQIYKIAQDGQLTIVGGNGTFGPLVAGPALDSPMVTYGGIVADDAGTVYFQTISSEIGKISPDGTLSILVDGTGAGPMSGPLLTAPIGYAPTLGLDAAGNLYVGDESNHQIEKITPAGQATVVAGDGTADAPAPGPAAGHPIGDDMGLAVSPAGDLYIADAAHNVIEHVTPDGTLSLIAGDGTAGTPVAGDPLASPVPHPGGIGVDPTGVVYAQVGNNPWNATQVLRIGPSAPSAPRDLTVTRTGTTATLGFLPPYAPGTTPVTDYEVSLDGGATWTTLTTTTGSGGRVSGTVTGVSSGAAHTFLVRARNGSGAGSDSDAASAAADAAAVTPAAATTAPAAAPAPVAVRKVCSVTRTVTLHWKAPRGAKIRSVAITVNGRTVAHPSAKARSAKVSLPASAGRVFTVKVVAKTSKGTASNVRTYKVCATKSPDSVPALALAAKR